MLDVKTWLESTGLPVKENHFKSPPALPYLVFVQDTRIRGSDSENCIVEREIDIELYSESIDQTSDLLIETLLDAIPVEYSKNREWIGTEQFFQTTFSFSLIERK